VCIPLIFPFGRDVEVEAGLLFVAFDEEGNFPDIGGSRRGRIALLSEGERGEALVPFRVGVLSAPFMPFAVGVAPFKVEVEALSPVLAMGVEGDRNIWPALGVPAGVGGQGT
jgi:hypothetical protein